MLEGMKTLSLDDQASPTSVSLGFTDYPQFATLGLWYQTLNVQPKESGLTQNGDTT